MNAEIWLLIYDLNGYVDACVDSYEGTKGGIPFAMLEEIQFRVFAIKTMKIYADDSVHVHSSLEEKFSARIAAKTPDNVEGPK